MERDIAKDRAMCEAATPGPWTYGDPDTEGDWPGFYNVVDEDGYEIAASGDSCRGRCLQP